MWPPNTRNRKVLRSIQLNTTKMVLLAGDKTLWSREQEIIDELHHPHVYLPEDIYEYVRVCASVCY